MQFENLSKEELIEELKKLNSEKFKYVNKFLEMEEKWQFTNFFLQKLNSVKQKKELCKIITDGFLKLTNSNFCVCILFNQDNFDIEFKNVTQTAKKNEDFENIIKKIGEKCKYFLNNVFDYKNITEYFRKMSSENLIIVPIIYKKNLLGFLMIDNDSENFYDENINFINIFPEHIALILENISLYQESEKLNKRKAEFLAGISHEFKTPLNSIIGFSDILKTKLSDEKSNKYLGNISQSSKHLLSLIQDVIDVSKSQYKLMELKYSEFNAKTEIIKIIDTLEWIMKEKKIKISYTLIDVEMSADLKRFRQLIYNLVSNAVKFNKISGKIIIITYLENGNFVFEITDTGDGISKRDYDKIFNFFSQVNRSQLKRQSGSGIGLALCKKITDAHNGKIAFKSKLKQGSTFEFSLPLKNEK